jgi:hypothetical protein
VLRRQLLRQSVGAIQRGGSCGAGERVQRLFEVPALLCNQPAVQRVYLPRVTG